MGGQGVDKVAHDLYRLRVTDEDSEVNREWARGPFSEMEMEDTLGPLFLPVRRFGVVQADKVRPVDGFSEFFHNACVTSTDKVNVSGVDAIASLIRVWSMLISQGSRRPNRKILLRLSDGTTLEGTLHEDFHEAPLEGTCIDLEKASSCRFYPRTLPSQCLH